MMIKSTKKNKRLAMMVGAALSFSAVYGIAPGDALAATYTIFYNDTTTQWQIVSEDDSNFNTAVEFTDSKLTDLQNALSTNAGSDIVNVIRPDGTHDNDFSITATNGIELGANDIFNVKTGADDSASTQFSMTAGADNDKLTYDNTSGGNKFEFTGEPSDVVVNVSNAELDLSGVTTLPANVNVEQDTTITVVGSPTIDTLTVADGATVTNSGGATTVTNLALGAGAGVIGGTGAGVTVSNKVNVTTGTAAFGEGVTLTGGLEIADGATVNITDNVTSGAVTGGGTLDIASGKTLDTSGGNYNISVGNITGTGGINAGTGKVNITGASANISGLSNVIADSVEASGTLTADAANIMAGTITSAGDLTLTGTPSGSVTIVESTGGKVTLADLGSVTSVTGNGIDFTGANPAVSSGVTLNAGTGTITAANGLDLSGADSTITAGTIEVSNGTFTPPSTAANLANVGTVKLEGSATIVDNSGAVNLGTTALDVSAASAGDNGGLGNTVTSVTAGSVKLNNNDANQGLNIKEMSAAEIHPKI